MTVVTVITVVTVATVVTVVKVVTVVTVVTVFTVAADFLKANNFAHPKFLLGNFAQVKGHKKP